jgi:asparagine synthase (glutamine-hydrolysing)
VCGICGIYQLGTHGSGHQQQVEAMSDAIAHRGPDGSGVYLDNHIALGHRRLSIIDLEGGDQPIFNEDQSVAIVFNGEIYNYRELYADLKNRHQFETASDTEVIVHLYEERGVECLEALNGMFGFAIWDKPRERLFIARDRLGEKPLYYHFQDGKFRFSSELKSLVADPGISRELDPQALEAYLSYGYVPDSMCILKGFHKLPAGHYLVLEKGNLSVQRYWQPTMPVNKDTRDEPVILDELEALLKESINIRLRSDVPVGAFLSGGIDSSLTVAMAAEESSSTLSTFSVGFSEEDFDELQYAKLVADRYGTNHHEIILDDLDSDLFPKMVAHFDEPFSDPSAIPTYYVAREAARHLKVCLSGDAGDELFCGYTRYNYEPLEQFFNAIPLGARSAIAGGAAAILPDAMPGKGRLRRISVDNPDKWQRMVGPFDSIERQALYRDEFKHLVTSPDLFAPYFANAQLDEISQRMWADQGTYLTDDILVKVDRNAMWHSLEVRVPMLDHRIVELANRMPLSLKRKNGIQKYPLKHMLKGRVPDEILTRPKRGFGLPIKHWLRDSMKDFAQEMLTSSDTRLRQYLDAGQLSDLVNGHNAGGRDLSKRIWTLLWLEQWCREFGS